MSSSTALLPKDVKKNDHPLFSRVCHSPWVSIGQQALVSLRGLTTAYQCATFGMLIDYQLRYMHKGNAIFFDWGNIVYMMQVIYAVVACTWTFMHLHYPHSSDEDDSFGGKVKKFFSPPKQNPKTKNRACFSIFYTAATAFPHVVTVMFWALLVPANKADTPPDMIYHEGWFKGFYYTNKYGINSAIALVEVFFMSSVKQQFPIWAHVQGLAFLSIAYFGWSFVSDIVTGDYPLYFFDHAQVGWEYVISSAIGFVAAGQAAFAIVYFVITLRETCCEKMDKKADDGYMSLPQ